jgi:hypothetical protein
MRSFVRHITPAVVALILAVAAPLAAASSAAAAVTQVDCVGSATVQYSPGITNASQSVTVTNSTHYTCEQALPLPVTTYTGSTHSSHTTEASCTDLLSAPSGTITNVLIWDDGQTSTFVYTATAVRADSTTTTTLTGLITAGRYSGSDAVLQAVFPNPSVLECGAPGGVTSLTGDVVLTIVAT